MLSQYATVFFHLASYFKVNALVLQILLVSKWNEFYFWRLYDSNACKLKKFMPIMIMLEKYYTFYIQFLKINQLFFFNKYLKKDKCSIRSMEVKLPALVGSYDRPTDRPTNRTTKRPTDRQVNQQTKGQNDSWGRLTSINALKYKADP